MYVKIETSRLQYFRNKQHEIRADLYQGLVDSVAAGEDRGSLVDHRLILPVTFIGGPRDLRHRYMDAMSRVQLVQWFGKPDIFQISNGNPWMRWISIVSGSVLGLASIPVLITTS